MTHDARIRDALASHATDFAVGAELHAVPPHVTHAVKFEGRRAVCKAATGPEAAPETEARVLEYARRASDLPVPEVLAVGDDHFVAAWRDGLPGETEPDEGKLRAMGRGLAELHEATAGDFGGTGRLRATEDGLAVVDPGRWSDTLLALLADRRASLAAHGYDDVAAEVADFVRARRDPFEPTPDPVLVHGNWLPEHVAVADGDVTAVVDFEHALVGPPGWDYLRAVGPVFGPDGETARGVPEAVFREGYESVRPLPAGFEDRRRAYAVVNGVSYLRALHLQRAPLDDPDEVARRAERLVEVLRSRLAALRRARGGS